MAWARSGLPAMVFVVSLVGCQSYQSSVMSTKIGAVSTLVGAAFITGAYFSVSVNNEILPFALLAVGVPAASTGLALLGGGLIGMLIHRGLWADPAPTPPAP